MAEPIFNGRTKIVLGVGGALAILSAVFTAGMSYAQLAAHTKDAVRHESPAQKEARIDDRIKLNLEPIKVELRELNKKLDRLIAEEKK